MAVLGFQVGDFIELRRHGQFIDAYTIFHHDTLDGGEMMIGARNDNKEEGDFEVLFFGLPPATVEKGKRGEEHPIQLKIVQKQGEYTNTELVLLFSDEKNKQRGQRYVSDQENEGYKVKVSKYSGPGGSEAGVRMIGMAWNRYPARGGGKPKSRKSKKRKSKRKSNRKSKRRSKKKKKRRS